MFIIVASCMIDLNLEVEAFKEAMYGCSFLGCRVRVGKMCRDRELEISEILLMVDPQDWGVTTGHHYIHVHGDITSSQVWVHSMDIHHS